MKSPDKSGRNNLETPTQEKLRVYGDAMFLCLRSQHHSKMRVENLRAAIEPPIETGQFRIFRVQGVPRGMFTWAFLNPDAEHRLVSGKTLTFDDWTSGNRMWLIDIIAPYRGMTSAMSRWAMKPGNISENGFLFRRVTNGNQTKKILSVDFSCSDNKAQIFNEAEFLQSQEQSFTDTADTYR